MSVISSHLLINLFARKRIFSIRLIIPLIFADPRWGTTKLDYRLSQHVLTGKQLAQPATELKKKHFNCEPPYCYRNTYLLHKHNTCMQVYGALWDSHHYFHLWPPLSTCHSDRSWIPGIIKNKIITPLINQLELVHDTNTTIYIIIGLQSNSIMPHLDSSDRIQLPLVCTFL